MGQRFRQAVQGCLNIGLTRHPRSLANKIEESRIFEAVEDIASISTGHHQAFAAQRHQVLRYVRLSPARSCFQVTDAGLALPNRQQDLQMRGLSQNAKQSGEFLG